MQHNILLKVTVALLCVLVVLTFLSRTIANAALVTVQTTKPVKSVITVSSKYTGAVRFDGDWTLSYSQPLSVTSVNVKSGDKVKAGQTLMTVDSSAFALELKRQDLTILQLQDQIAETTDSRALAELNLQLDIAQTAEDQYKAANPTDGNITAPAAGVVLNVTVPGPAAPGAALAEIYDPNSPANVVFTLSEQDGDTFAQDDGLSVVLNTSQQMFDYTTGTNVDTAVQQNAAITQRVYDATAHTYDFYAPISGKTRYQGQSIDVQLVQSSPA